jgi:hypothetical protein
MVRKMLSEIDYIRIFYKMVKLAITLAPRNIDDRASVSDMLKDISCKLIGDKGPLIIHR